MTIVMVEPIMAIIAPYLVISLILYQTDRLKNMPRKRLANSTIGTINNPSQNSGPIKYLKKSINRVMPRKIKSPNITKYFITSAYT